MAFFVLAAHARRSGWLSALVACWLPMPTWALPPAPLAPARAVNAEVSQGAQRKLAQGRVIGLDNGDTACHIKLADTEGRVHHELADFALCEEPEKLLNRQVTLSYTTVTVPSAACQGNTRCAQKDTVALITRATVASTAPSVDSQTPIPRGSWCTDAETNLFTCHPRGKRVSVCASKGATARHGQLQYRFGPAKGGAAELTLPATATPPARSATGDSAGFAGGGGAWLRFSQGNHGYVVYSGVGRWGRNGATEERYGVQVERNGKVLATLACHSTDVNELGPDWFARMGIAPDAQGFSFPGTDN